MAEVQSVYIAAQEFEIAWIAFDSQQAPRCSNFLRERDCERANMAAGVKHRIPGLHNTHKKSEFRSRMSTERDNLIGDNIIHERINFAKYRVHLNNI
jgi:hypothetical protein